VIERFTEELEALGGHVHRGRDALERLRGEGVSVTPCLALIADTERILWELRDGGKGNHRQRRRARGLTPGGSQAPGERCRTPVRLTR
jgi:hypothetical protein